METIKITEAIQIQIADVIAAGKTPWVIINEDYVVGIYAGRTEARNAKADQKLAGTIAKASDYNFELVNLQEDVAPVTETEKPAPKAKREVTHESTVERPCKLVWQIADDMKAANPKVTRREVLDAAVTAGVAYYTARTQYQQWLSVQREMSEREAKQQGKQ